MKIVNKALVAVFGQKHLDEVAEIQKNEAAKRNKEMEDLSNYQDSYRAQRREQSLQRGRELQESMKQHYAELDAKNAVRREKLNGMIKSVTDFFSRKWF